MSTRSVKYNTQYKCNYNSSEIFKNVNIENIETAEEYDMREILYRQDLLYIFSSIGKILKRKAYIVKPSTSFKFQLSFYVKKKSIRPN